MDENQDYAQVLIETTPAGQVVYTYGDDLISQDRDGVLSLYHYDGLGSTRFLSDAGGAVTDWYDYVAFGEVLNQTGGTENFYLFAGEQFDSFVGQYYLRARYYDQGVGRFTQMDRWQGRRREPVTLNGYLYANVDPVNHVDPSGHYSVFVLTMPMVRFTTTIAVGQVLKRVAVAAVVGVGLNILYRQLMLEITVVVMSESATDNTERQAEYDILYRLTRMPPEPGNDCSSLSKNIHYAEAVIKRYEAWDAKWLPGRHAQKIADWKRRLENLKKEHKKRCT